MKPVYKSINLNYTIRGLKKRKSIHNYTCIMRI